MLNTVRQIESALSAKSTSSIEKEIGTGRSTGKVAVMMPAGMKSMVAREITEQHVKYAPAIAVADVEPEIVSKTTEKNGNGHPKKAQQSGWLFDPMEEIPTLAHQHSQELNDIIGSAGTSLNDHLREEKTEVAHKLTETPIRDLKKGIGVNDRFVFLNELFRGDEAMYERSLKTINGFRILPEAEYWINRELKIKLGWIDDQPTVRHFYQLVRRRFS